MLQIGRDIIVNYFWRGFVSLEKFTYWSKFHVNIITGSRLMTIFLHKKLARNPEIENTSSWVLPNILRLEQFRDINFGTNVFNKMLLNISACQGYIFYCFWIIKEKLKGQKGGRGRGIKLPSKKKVLLLHALKTLT